MKQFLPYILFFIPQFLWAAPHALEEVLIKADLYLVVDSPETKLPYPIEAGQTDPNKKHSMDLEDPNNMVTDIEYDALNNEYHIVTKIGDQIIRTPITMSYQEYIEYQFQKRQKEYLKQKSNAYSHLGRKRNQRFANKIGPKGVMPGNLIEITPKLSVDLTFGAFYQNRDNPALTERARRQGGFDFNMDIQANIVGNIGDLVQLNFNYNTKSNFSFDNQMNLAYTGKEDHIIKKIEAGNITLPTKSSLITGSSNLLGIKTELQFGRLTVTGVASQLQGSKNNIRLEGGAQRREFEVDGLNYDYNKHFFLGHFFREKFEHSMSQLPMILSNARVNRIEVWVTNTNRQPTNSREVIALMDLGEPLRINNPNFVSNFVLAPDSATKNSANDAYSFTTANRENLRAIETSNKQLTNITDFQITNARLLNPSEFFVDTMLGYITINRRLNPDEVLAVAYEYTVADSVYKVGEFSNELMGSENEATPTLVLKMLKSSRVDPKTTMWDLMMKNIYSLNAYQVAEKDFFLNIFYRDPGGGSKRFIPEGSLDGIPLLEVLQLDNLNAYGQPFANGFFDFLNGRTIIAQKGRLIFPILEPFAGERRENGRIITTGIRTYFGNETALGEKYAFDELYDSTQVIASQYPEFNRFVIKGSYSSSVTSDISLGRMQIPQGSVTVTAGGAPLTEGVDYTVDYMMGRVKILRQDILNSGTPIDISFDSQNLVGINNKSLTGARFDYWINDNFTLGSTVIKISENPFQLKTQYGNEPINNTIYGFDANYHSELPFLTKLIDALPLIKTKEKSSVTLSAEYARLIPGHPKVVGDGSDLDNFEGAKLPFRIDDPARGWTLASAPTGESDLPEASLTNDLAYGKNRALLNWNIYDQPLIDFPQQPAERQYIIDNGPQFYSRGVKIKEIWPERQIGFNQDVPERVLNLSFYPNQRGPYNYDTEEVNSDGTLNNTQNNWGGIMKYLPVTDFEALNYELLEFWVLDPFWKASNDTSAIPTGELIFNLGDVSEDVLKDGNIQYENGLPSLTNLDPVIDTSIWGVTPATAPIALTFDIDVTSRAMQDVGLDGLNDSMEQIFFKDFIDRSRTIITNEEALAQLEKDPSTDNYKHFYHQSYDPIEANIIERYKGFNGLDGNSPVNQEGIDSSFNQMPTTEDLNRNNTLDDAENYYEYRIKVSPEDFQVGQNYIITKVDTTIMINNNLENVTWYQFQIPVRQFSRKVGNIEGFRSIRYLRMYLKGFTTPVHMRFATMDLIRNQWRKYDKSLFEGEDLTGINSDNLDSKDFNVTSVSLFENGTKYPVNYVIPPGINQEIQFTTQSTSIQQDERSMAVNVCNLVDGDARAVFKNMQWDVRLYNTLKAFVHGESVEEFGDIQDGELTVFLRFGMDNTFNYYEFEKPLKITQPLATDPLDVWDSLIIQLQDVVDIKQERNNANFDANRIYSKELGDGRLYIKGSPDLSQIKSFMLGVRNPSQSSPFNPLPDDDGLEKCAEVWFNELKLQGFDEEGGSAALAMMELQLADLGDFVFSGQMHTRGFGAVDAAILDRYLDDYYTYTASTQLNLHKFTPKSWNLNIPMYASVTEQLSTPKYDPFQGDIKLDDQLQSLRNSGMSEDSIKLFKRSTGDYEKRRSFNLTNIKKNKSTKKKKTTPLDISNFSATYRFLEVDKTNPFIARNSQTTQQGILNYSFSTSPKNHKPFRKLKIKSKLFKPIKEFNFTLLPSNISIISNLNRQIGEVQLRALSGESTDVPLPSYFDKRFDWNRNYSLKYKPTKSINVDYNSSVTSFLNEPKNISDRVILRQAIWDSLRASFDSSGTIGIITGFNQRASANYKLPFNKFPIISFLNAKVNYKTNYSWSGANQILPQLGNTLQNGRDFSINASLKSRTLYKEGKTLYKDIAKLFDKKKEEESKNKKSKPKSAAEKRKSKKRKRQTKAGKFVKKAVTGIKTTSITYSDKRATILPAFLQNPFAFGQSLQTGEPGLAFSLLGLQPFANQAQTESPWLNDLAKTRPDGQAIFSTDTTIFQTISWTETEVINAKFGVEWIKSLRLDLNWTRNYTSATTGFFDYNDGSPEILSRRTQGNFKFSTINWGSAFNGLPLSEDTVAFYNFLDNRQIMSQAIGDGGNHSIEQGFSEGFGSNVQTVMIPAFIAAYTNSELDTSDARVYGNPERLKQVIPLPNWRLTYSGLGRLKPFKKLFKSVTISHSYNSNYSLNSFVTNLEYDPQLVMDGITDTLGNLQTKYIISQVSMVEQFSPLISIKSKMKSGFDWNFSYSKSRNVNLSFATFNINEQKTKEIKFGGGYKIKPGWFIKPLNYTTVKPINTKIDFSIRDNITTLFGISDKSKTHTGGTQTIAILITADYQYSKNMNIRFNLDWKKTVPYTSNNFPITSLNTGVTLRYTL